METHKKLPTPPHEPIALLIDSAQDIPAASPPSPCEPVASVTGLPHGESPITSGDDGNAGQHNTKATCREIKRRHRALIGFGRRNLEEAIELGGLLYAAKGQLPHGKWRPFLDEAEIEHRTASNYLRLYDNRDELRAKYESNSLLTITGSLKMLQSAKPKHGSPSRARARDDEAALSMPIKSPDRLIDVTAEVVDLVEIPGEKSAPGEHMNQHLLCVAPRLDGDSVDLTEEELMIDATSSEDTPLDDLQNVTPSRDDHPSTPATSEQTVNAQEADGFLLADGARLRPDPWDDGPIPSEWVQMQITMLKSNNDAGVVKSKRSLAALKTEQTFLIELARTANRLLDTTEATTEPLKHVLNGAVHRLRNYTTELCLQK